ASSEGRRGRVPPPSDQSAVSTQTICSPATMTVSWSSDQPGTSAQPWRKPSSSVEEPSEYAWPSTEYRAFAARQGVSTSSAPDRPGGAHGPTGPRTVLPAASREMRMHEGRRVRGALFPRRVVAPGARILLCGGEDVPCVLRRETARRSGGGRRGRSVPGQRAAMVKRASAISARGTRRTAPATAEGQDDGLGLLILHIAWSNRGSRQGRIL